MNHQMIDEKQAGEFLGWSEATMRLNRRAGRGPAFYKLGKKVRYRLVDLEGFVERQRVDPASGGRIPQRTGPGGA